MEVRSVREPSAEGKWFYGAIFTSQLFLVEGVAAARLVNECADLIEQGNSNLEKIEPEFCKSVVALRNTLRTLKKTCEDTEAHWSTLPFESRNESERVFLPNMAAKIRKIFVHFNIKIASQIDVENLPADSIYHQIVHEEIYPFFSAADIARRAYEKPRGYAGDYEMMNQIYRSGYEGSGLFGRVMHNYITNENSGDSVRFRRDYFANHVKALVTDGSQVKRVLSVASGPAVELQKVVREVPQDSLDHLHFTLFDLDREALEHAQTKLWEIGLQEGKQINADFINSGVKSFLTSSSLVNHKFDLIYSAGLFDYLDNPTCGALVKTFSGLLNPGGTLIVGNFTKENLTKAYLHLITKWILIHKTEEEVRAWANGINGCEIRIDYDDLRMNAFLVLRKNAPS